VLWVIRRSSVMTSTSIVSYEVKPSNRCTTLTILVARGQ
jgi:hypothetical protein